MVQNANAMISCNIVHHHIMAVIILYVYEYISYFQMATHASMASMQMQIHQANCILQYYGINLFIMSVNNGILNLCTKLLTICQ
jgi:hypothetical protein